MEHIDEALNELYDGFIAGQDGPKEATEMAYYLLWRILINRGIPLVSDSKTFHRMWKSGPLSAAAFLKEVQEHLRDQVKTALNSPDLKHDLQAWGQS